MASIGVRLPLKYDSNDGYGMIKTVRAMLRQNFKMLLLTIPGERVMEPNYGIGVKQHLFKNFSGNLPTELRSRIEKQTKTYMPAIRIISMDVVEYPDTNSISLQINYTIPSVGINDLLKISI